MYAGLIERPSAVAPAGGCVMSEQAEPEAVAVTKLVLELQGGSTSVTLRIKPDRRQRQLFFPPALDRRAHAFHRAPLTQEPHEVAVRVRGVPKAQLAREQ